MHVIYEKRQNVSEKQTHTIFYLGGAESKDSNMESFPGVLKRSQLN